MVPRSAAVSTAPVIEAVTEVPVPLMVITADIRYPGELIVTSAARATGSTAWLVPQPPAASTAPAAAHNNGMNRIFTCLILPIGARLKPPRPSWRAGRLQPVRAPDHLEHDLVRSGADAVQPEVAP